MHTNTHQFEELFEKIKKATNQDILNMVEKMSADNNNCHHCEKNNWAVIGDGDHLYTPMHVQKHSLSIEIGSMTPMAYVICNDCGYTKTFTLGRLILAYDARFGSQDKDE